MVSSVSDNEISNQSVKLDEEEHYEPAPDYTDLLSDLLSQQQRQTKD